jgi:hypothetical protein
MLIHSSQQIQQILSAKYRSESIGKELPTTMMKAIVDKTIPKPTQKLQQWQIYAKGDILGFQQRLQDFKATKKGQGMKDLAAMQHVALDDLKQCDDDFIEDLDRQRELEYQDRWAKYQMKKEAFKTHEPDAREYGQ